MIQFMPKTDSLLWARKCIRTFDSIEDLRRFIAAEKTRIAHYIGMWDKHYQSQDIDLVKLDRDYLHGWQNFRSVILDGKIIGYCGE